MFKYCNVTNRLITKIIIIIIILCSNINVKNRNDNHLVVIIIIHTVIIKLNSTIT